MGYASERSGRSRLGAGAAVVALHAGIGAALLATFAGGIITRVVDEGLDAQNWTWAPPPPEPPRPVPAGRTRTADNTTLKAPKTPFEPLVPSRGVETLDPGPLLPPPGPVGLEPAERFVRPDPAPSPTGAAVAARAKGDPGTWITRNDYPTRAIREDWTGLTRLRLAIGADGRVTDCTIVASSGHAELDSVACNRVSARARFDSARDGDGAPVAGQYETAVRWVIQD